jgi:type VI secretion system secreted protein Hcp
MAYDAYMYFTGGTPAITGETSDSKMSAKNAFEIYSFSWGASNPATIGSGSTGLAAGKVSLSSFNVMKKTDSSSTALFQACATGAHYPTAVVELRKAAGTSQLVFLTYTFTEVMIESIQWSGSSGGDDTPTESVSFAFGKVAISYNQQDSTGAAKGGAKTGGWNVMTNTPS